MKSVINFRDPATMAAEERVRELAQILAAGCCRVLARKGRIALADLASPAASWDHGAAAKAPGKEVA